MFLFDYPYVYHLLAIAIGLMENNERKSKEMEIKESQHHNRTTSLNSAFISDIVLPSVTVKNSYKYILRLNIPKNAINRSSTVDKIGDSKVRNF